MEAASPPAVPYETLADRLRRARIAARYSQDELARVTGISRKTISRYENGHTIPRRPDLLAWAVACNVPLDWLTHGEPSAVAVLPRLDLA